MRRGMRVFVAAAAAVVMLAAGLTGSIVAAPSPAEAADLSKFKPGNIISDDVFFNHSTMSVAQIQQFLESKVSKCLTGYTCLINYRQDTPNRPKDPMCSGYTGAKNESAATIIYKVAKACKVNPQVIIVTLQKEQGFITDDWPSARMYRSAMGYGCPDTADCDVNYYGFFNQVYTGTWAFQRYTMPPGTGPGTEWYSTFRQYAPGKTVNVQYHPNSACGTKAVKIENEATSSLYTYTPYTPNQAALNAGYGLGNGCSAYGNRNFYNYFTDWFGSTHGFAGPVDRLSGDDRYSTAIAVSKAAYPGVANAVYVTTGADFPDALAAAPAAAQDGAPLLLTPAAALPANVKAEIQRLKPKKIVVVGGPGVVSKKVFDAVKQLAPTTTRIGGRDRYETSRLVAEHAFSGANIAYLATGHDFPDALSASAAGGALKAPVVLVDGNRGAADTATKALLTKLRVSKTIVVGGSAVVSSGIERSLTAFGPTRQSGSDRYATSRAVNRSAFPAASRVFFATGMAFPDALAGAAMAGTMRSPVYLVPQKCVPNNVLNDLISMRTTKVTLLGGVGVLSDRVMKLNRC